ncbi:DUF3168 domain-containing protein [Amaricoccus sp. HAR-UPW-R2A-40]|nr:DUF3168 domain-containing protein [Amaricoccus sp. HAR-UPW-R2A-40]
MSAALALQIALRERLLATPAVIDLVPAEHILDRNQRPNPDPSIILGEAQELDDDDSLDRRLVRIYHTFHVWRQEPSLEGVTAIMAAARTAALAGRLALSPGFHCVDLRVASSRAMRDPDGETSHGVMTLEARIQEVET